MLQSQSLLLNGSKSWMGLTVEVHRFPECLHV